MANENLSTIDMAAAFERCVGISVSVEMRSGRAFSGTVLGLCGDRGRRTHVRMDSGDTHEVRVSDVASFTVL